MTFFGLMSPNRTQSPKKVGSFCVHMTVDGEELTMEKDREKLTQSGLPTTKTDEIVKNSVKSLYLQFILKIYNVMYSSKN